MERPVLSTVAEFAYNLHIKNRQSDTRKLNPVKWKPAFEKVNDIRVVIFDVYGTLINYWRTEFAKEDLKTACLLDTFRKTAEFFGMEPFLREMDPSALPEKTLSDLYHGLITLKHNAMHEKKMDYPEIRIEEVWLAIMLMLKRRGYVFPDKAATDDSEAARFVAYYYNFTVFNRALYPGVVDALSELKKENIRLGILSNAQFYTSIDLTLLLRDQSGNRIEDLSELFDTDLIFYSYEYNMAKPGHIMFRRLYDTLYEYDVLPSQTVFVGNDLASDIKPASVAGMKTALFAGDDQCMFVHGEDNVTPDIVFTAWNELPSHVSFHEK
jgi:putative hydrolase of the HAD superfamily